MISDDNYLIVEDQNSKEIILYPVLWVWHITAARGRDGRAAPAPIRRIRRCRAVSPGSPGLRRRRCPSGPCRECPRRGPNRSDYCEKCCAITKIVNADNLNK